MQMGKPLSFRALEGATITYLWTVGLRATERGGDVWRVRCLQIEHKRCSARQEQVVGLQLCTWEHHVEDSSARCTLKLYHLYTRASG